MKEDEITTIKLKEETKSRLDRLRESKRESYDEILRKMLGILNLIKQEPDKARGILGKIHDSHERNLSGKSSGQGIPEEKQSKREKMPEKIIRKIELKQKQNTISGKFLKRVQNRQQGQATH